MTPNPNPNSSMNTVPLPMKRPKYSALTTDFSEFGHSGIKQFSGRIYEEFLSSLQGPKGIAVYREMSENDEVVGSSLYAMERIIAQADWFVSPADDSNESLRDAEFLRSCMNDMEHSWSDFILEAFSCIAFGWCICEEVFKLRKGSSENKRTNSKFTDGMIGWRKISRRLQWTLYQWDIDNSNGDILGMVQNPPPDYGFHYIPINKCAYFRTRLAGNNPEGRSVLRNSYKPYYYKKTIQILEAIGVERDLVGLPVIEPPEDFDIDDKDNAPMLVHVKSILANLRRDEQDGIFLPPGWKISLLGSGATRRQFDVDKIINRYDKRIAITMLAQFIMLGMDRVGSFALSNNQNDLFKLAVQGYLNRMAETINTYTIPRLFKLNPTLSTREKFPKVIPGNISAPNLTDLAAYINALGRYNLLPTDNKEFVAALMKIGRFYEANTDKIGDIYSSGDFKISPNAGEVGSTSTSTSTSMNSNGNADSSNKEKTQSEI
jgi:hypothetical protein